MIYEITKDEEIRSMNYANLGCIPNVTQESTLEEIIAAMPAYSSVTTWINTTTHYPTLYAELQSYITPISGLVHIFGNLTIEKTNIATTIILRVRSMPEHTYMCSYSTTSTGWGEWQKVITHGTIKSKTVTKSVTMSAGIAQGCSVAHELTNIIPLGITGATATITNGVSNRDVNIKNVAVTDSGVNFTLDNATTLSTTVTGSVTFSYIQL